MDTRPKIELPYPPLYLPMRNGRYDVAPGLTRLSVADFGNGACDRNLFQFDRDFERFRRNKQNVRALERPDRHFGRMNYGPDVAAAVARRIIAQLVNEHPQIFSLEEDADGACRLHSALTGETLQFDPDGVLRMAASGQSYYDDALNALCSQFSEDIAIVRRDTDGRDWISAFDICAPSHWAPEEKLGCSFDSTHVPVPGMERSRAAANGLVDAMIVRPPTVRFTWGIEFSNRLNQHPMEISASRGFAPATDPEEGAPLFLRVERQTTWGLPEVSAALFAIRVYIYDASKVIADQPQRREILAAALRSMSPESRIYKGLPPDVFDVVLRWLQPNVL